MNQYHNQPEKDCECLDSYFKRIRMDGRDYIEKISAEDAKHGINSMGLLAAQNAYGEIGSYCTKCKRILPVICGHGGSMWLCRKCADKLVPIKEKIDEITV